MLFKPFHIPKIREGTKTVTRRVWKDGYNRPKEGATHQASTEMFCPDEECDCYIRILDVYREPLGEVTEEQADLEGGYTLSEFKESWADIVGEWDPEQVVDVVQFEYVGRERPEANHA